MKDIEVSSWILVLKLGQPRPFAFYQSAEEEKPFWQRTLSAGTAVFMNARGNSLVRHGVPRCDTVGASGSIVSRCITTMVPWAEVSAAAAKTVAARREKGPRPM